MAPPAGPLAHIASPSEPTSVAGAGATDAASSSAMSPSPIKSLAGKFSGTSALPGDRRPLFGGLLRFGSSQALGSCAGASRASPPDAAHRAEDDDLEDIAWDQNIPIKPESLNAPLPPSQLFSSLRRMRHTINEYANNMANIGWLCSFQLQTLQALARRFKALSEKIVGGKVPSVNIELGYKPYVQPSPVHQNMVGPTERPPLA